MSKKCNAKKAIHEARHSKAVKSQFQAFVSLKLSFNPLIAFNWLLE